MGEVKTRTVYYTVKTWFDGPALHGEQLPAGRIVRVEADVILPANATHAEVLEWVNYTLGYGSIATANPLSDHDLEVYGEPTLTDTGRTTDRLTAREDAMAWDFHPAAPSQKATQDGSSPQIPSSDGE